MVSAIGSPERAVAGSVGRVKTWPSMLTDFFAASATVAFSVLRWPTKVATKRVAGRL
jgi:hypothetical protein